MNNEELQLAIDSIYQKLASNGVGTVVPCYYELQEALESLIKEQVRRAKQAKEEKQ